MKDEDFDTLGKRLYDLEADPPKDGWEKLSPIVATAPAGKFGWIRRNAWKSLFIVMPVLFYSVYHIFSLEESTSITATFEIDASEKSDIQPLNKKVAKPSQPDQVNDKNKNHDVVLKSLDLSSENSNSKNVERSKPISIQSNNKERVIEETNSYPSSSENVAKNFSSFSVDAKGGMGEFDIPESTEKITDADSVKLMVEEILQKEELEEVDTISLEQPEDKEEKAIREWRISATFAPAYQINPVQPIINDEVYVTDVDNSTPFKKSGYGFSFGLGRNISSNFYLDAQLSYTKIKQDIFYTFATGKIDTLLAIQQPDNSVLVKPVYEIMDRELRSTHHYGGLRMMATYYFWSKPTSRFNLSATMGAHYLVASILEENRSGHWSEISSEPEERMNYSFMVGAGYNFKVGHGWEFMINPTLSYFLSEVKLKGVPYSLNQQSLGINLMVSKTLLKKQ